MASGSLKVKLRPLRLAFIVEPDDRGALHKAIQTTSFLWGGSYNPIIPFNRRLSIEWRKRRGGVSLSAQEVTNGYLDAFDPDFVVLVGELEKQPLTFGHREILKCSEIISTDPEDVAPNVGIGLFEIFNDFQKCELKYVRNEAIPICIPKPSRADALFFASLFGALPKPIEETFLRSLPQIQGLSQLECSSSQYVERLAGGVFSFRRLGLWNVEPVTNGLQHSECIFFMDSRVPSDVLDFWNLRALGWTVIPVCRHSCADQAIVAEAGKYVDDNYQPLRGNPAFYNNTLILPSRPDLAAEAARFAKSLPLKKSQEGSKDPLVFLPFYPRIWDTWAREKDGAVPCRLEVTEKEYPLDSMEGRLRFTSLVPEFATRFGGNEGHRCANQVEVRVWGHDRPIAEIIPEGGDDLVRSFAEFGAMEWRCSRFGPVYYPRHRDWQESIKLMDAGEVFCAWLNGQGWAATISDKGHIAFQMFRHLGGTGGLNFIAIPGLVGFLGKLGKYVEPTGDAERDRLLYARAGEGRMSSPKFFAELNQLANATGSRKGSAERLAQRLVATKMVQLGIEVQCPRCLQKSWYSITDADYEIECPKCLSSFSLPSSKPSALTYSYRAIGPFSIRDQSYGSLTVLLALNFFIAQMRGSTTPLFSATLKKGQREHEADLALFFRESTYRECPTDLVFCECKSFNHFQKKDAARLGALGLEFQGAFLVFATLNAALTDEEKRLLRPIVNRGRKYWKNERPCNPVIILTATELFGEFSLRQTWTKAGGIHAQRSQRLSHRDHLLELADATQEIYLGLPTWHVWLESRRSKQHLPKKPQTAQPTPPTQVAPENVPIPMPVRMRQVPFA